MMNTSGSRYQQGASLVEVLVAAIVIGIGLLGIASLQVRSLQASTNAEARARATDLAWELADRIRANADADEYYITDGVLDNCDAYGTSNCSTVPGSSGIEEGACSKADVAAEDLLAVLCTPSSGIRSVLAEGTLEVTCADVDTTDSDACTPGSQLTITISWSVRDDVFGTGTDRVVMTVIPGDPQ